MTATPAEKMSPALHHTVRNSLVDPERRYSIGPDRLLWVDKNGSGSLAYSDIKSVQLISYGGNQYQTRVTRRSGGAVKIRSHHYVAFGSFENRRLTYAPFIRELCSQINATKPGVRFVSGSTMLWLLWWMIGLLAALVLILAVSMANLPSAPALPAFFVLIASIPLIWREAKKGRTATFDPTNPPPNILGAE